MHDWGVKSVMGIALGAAVVGGCAVLRDATPPPDLVIAGLVILGVAGAIAPPGKLAVGMILTAWGAGLVGYGGGLDHPWWFATTAFLSITMAAPLVAGADARWDGAPIAFAIAALGVFACVPDTEEARVLLVVAVVAALVSLVPSSRVASSLIPSSRKHLGPAGAAVCTGVFVWVAAFDARGRPAAYVGAVAALGLLVFEPVGVRVRGGRAPRLAGRRAEGAALGAQLALAAYASRVVGLERSVASAVALAIPAALLGVAVGALLGPTTRSPS